MIQNIHYLKWRVLGLEEAVAGYRERVPILATYVTCMQDNIGTLELYIKIDDEGS